jgi:hypothetical protein
MKRPFEPRDKLLKSLVEETVALPQAAAAHARAQQRNQMTRIRLTAMLAISLLAVGIWFSQHGPRDEAQKEMAHAAIPPEAAKTLTQQGYVKVHQPGESADMDPIPPDVSDREQKLLRDLSGVPLLIVKNDAGEVARVHIFER